jgi:Uma2 family endonuclease
MAMPVTVPRYTLRDLESFPDDGSRYELLDGVLLVTPAPARLHQLVVSRIVRQLGGYLPATTADIFSPGVLEVEPNVHLEPDILVVPAGAAGPEAAWTEIRSWWLAVEVSGESKLYDRDHKTPAYLQLGVREVWRVDLRERRMFVSVSDNVEQPQAEQVSWLPPGRQDPLVITIPDLFR